MPDPAGDLTWLKDWVTDQRAQAPAEPSIDPWAGEEPTPPEPTHPAHRPSEPDVAPKAGRDAQESTDSAGLAELTDPAEAAPTPADSAQSGERTELAGPGGSAGSTRSEPAGSAELAEPARPGRFVEAGPARTAAPGGSPEPVESLRSELAESGRPVRFAGAVDAPGPAGSAGASDFAGSVGSVSSVEHGVRDPLPSRDDQLARLRSRIAEVSADGGHRPGGDAAVAESDDSSQDARLARLREQVASLSAQSVQSGASSGGDLSDDDRTGQSSGRPARVARRSAAGGVTKLSSDEEEPGARSADEREERRFRKAPSGEGRRSRKSSADGARRAGNADERDARQGRRASADHGGDPEAHAKDICLTLLTARPRTRAELYKALVRKEIAPEVAERVLGRLDQVGLIDDKAFAEIWVRSRHTYQGMGRKALSIELRRRGVDNDTAAEAVAAVDEEAEEERARQLVRKKLSSLRSADQQTKIRRLVGMLARKGYSQGLAYRVVKDELSNVGDESDLLDTIE
nr:Regulatory protein RecX [Kibdelosporangium sp. MJ126-NF4]CTQ96492.1 Regulatory protein RecX [Kibdelosporangium sp. MJ126-NF4]